MTATTKTVIVLVIRAVRRACTVCRRVEIRHAHLWNSEIRKCPQQKKDGDDAIHSCQNRNFSAACITLGGAALTTCPNKGVVMPPSTAVGPKNCA